MTSEDNRVRTILPYHIPTGNYGPPILSSSYKGNTIYRPSTNLSYIDVLGPNEQLVEFRDNTSLYPPSHTSIPVHTRNTLMNSYFYYLNRPYGQS
jgi:hypothetical protein